MNDLCVTNSIEMKKLKLKIIETLHINALNPSVTMDPSRAMINAEILAKTLLVDYIELVEQSVPDHFQEVGRKTIPFHFSIYYLFLTGTYSSWRREYFGNCSIQCFVHFLFLFYVFTVKFNNLFKCFPPNS